MKSAEIRDRFVSFFVRNGHTAVPSSSVIPADDPTLLFTNAGMNQFKDVFLGHEKRHYTRAVSIQKCIRAGGKHNDLDNVGFTARHLTFFEMMGNFSFGDYFKEKAIEFAWEFLTSEVKLDAHKLWASVYEDDHEAYALWKKIIPAERIVRLGAEDNFWQMGDRGPCGPCSEIYIDQGRDKGCQKPTCSPGCACNRFLEIWNLVFMQFDRQKDGSNKPLSMKSVDTGMGLERLCAVLQKVHSVFETDIFKPILHKIEQLTNISYQQANSQQQAAFRVIADHIRSASYAIADGCIPAADGRGYVLRKIIRRAALFAHKLSAQPFFPFIVDGLIIVYPKLASQRDTIVAILEKEGEQFSKNLVRGKQLLEEYIAEHQPTSHIAGTMAFTLYDTYGFPLELTRIIAHEHNMIVDEEGFMREMAQQRSLSGLKESTEKIALDGNITTEFTGYDEMETHSSVRALFDETFQPLEKATPVQQVWVITAACPFYAESGGQISDAGTVTLKGQTYPIAKVQKQGKAVAFSIKTSTTIALGDEITMRVDEATRRAIMKNHTATHLLQAALMRVLGKGIKQSGSLVTPEYLRFDFTYATAITPEQLRDIEQFVNGAIWQNIPVTTRTTTLHDAQQQGVIAFFGEKYNPENVRVITIGKLSAELCGGTHVAATGELGLFKITDTTAPSTGNRRIVAVTGPSALHYVQNVTTTLKAVSAAYKTPEQDLVETIKKQQMHLKELQQQFKRVQQKLWTIQIPQWAQQARTIHNVPFGLVILESITSEDARDLVQRLTQHAPGLWAVITTEPHHERIHFAMALAPEYRQHHNLKHLLAKLTALGLKGGGSESAIQGSAPRLPEKLEEAIRSWLQAP